MQAPSPAPAPQPALPALARAILYVVGWLLATGAFFIPLMVILEGAGIGLPELEEVGGKVPATPQVIVTLLLGELAQLVPTVLVTLAFVMGWERQPFAATGLSWGRGALKELVWGFGFELLHFSALFGAGLAAGWWQVIGSLPLQQAATILLVATLIAFPAAAVEEITMRGYVLPVLESRYGTVAGVIGNSLIFAALHLANPNGAQWLPMIGLVVAGIYLSLCYLVTRPAGHWGTPWTGRLWFPIAVHTAWNVAEGPLYGLPVSGIVLPLTALRTRVTGPDLWTGGAFGPEAGMLVLVSTTLAAVAVWYGLRPLLQGTPPRDHASLEN